MTKKEYCHKLANIDEALYDTKKELKRIKLKIIMESDPDRKKWFVDAQERLRREKEDLDAERKKFVSENRSKVDD